jgi:hypothetical protein
MTIVDRTSGMMSSVVSENLRSWYIDQMKDTRGYEIIGRIDANADIYGDMLDKNETYYLIK